MRPRLLDLFCGAGGCSVGYDRAGFDVTGVDIEPHPDYPYEFARNDALEVLSEPRILANFDAIHASPPCQAFTTMSNRHRGKGGAADLHDELIEDTRELLEAWGGLWVIENVPGARAHMRAPVTLSGGMFGLGVQRPRLFESNIPLSALPDRGVLEPVGVYGSLDGRRLYTRADGSIQRAARTLEEGRQAMGIDWMNWDDLREAIPPAYTEWIGLQLIDHLEVAA